MPQTWQIRAHSHYRDALSPLVSGLALRIARSLAHFESIENGKKNISRRHRGA